MLRGIKMQDDNDNLFSVFSEESTDVVLKVYVGGQ
jgi:hypothetical protein